MAIVLIWSPTITSRQIKLRKHRQHMKVFYLIHGMLPASLILIIIANRKEYWNQSFVDPFLCTIQDSNETKVSEDHIHDMI